MGETRTEKAESLIGQSTDGTTRNNSRVDQFKNWFTGLFSNKKAMWMFLGILLLAISLRVFYFLITNGQTSWWDSAEYLSTGQHYLNSWKGITDTYMVNFQRPPLFTYIIALILGIGLGESTIVFVACIIPSILLVFFVYLLGKEMFNERVGLLASLFTALSWTLLFWSPRVQPDFISMCLQVGAMYLFFKTINNNGSKPKNMIWAGILSSLAFNFKISGLLVPMIIFVYMIFVQRFTMLKRKENWMFLLGFIVCLIPYFIWAWIMFGNPFILRSGYTSGIEKGDATFAWWVLDYFSIMFGDTVFFLIFIFGIAYSLFRVFSKFDLELKEPSKEFSANFFSILAILITACFYIFYIGGIEDRWVFIWLPFFFYTASIIILKVFDLFNKHVHTYAAWTFIIIAILFLGYGQVMHADALTNNKLDSYSQVKEASLWMKANSIQGEGILTISYTQMTFYSDRPVYTYSQIKEEEFVDWYTKMKPRYLVVSVFEPHPQWIYNWIQNNSRVTPVMGYFVNKNTTDPKDLVLVIYQLNY